MYAAAVGFDPSTPSSGYATSGTSEVTASGIASVNHSRAIATVMASSRDAAGGIGCDHGTSVTP